MRPCTVVSRRLEVEGLLRMNMKLRVLNTLSNQKFSISSSQVCVMNRRVKTFQIISPLQKSISPQYNFAFCSSTSQTVKLDTSYPFAYYDILEIPRNAKQSEVKKSYLRLAKLYHPDMAGDGKIVRENFDALTEAYTTLIDLTQRYFYDQHGHSCEELKKKGSNSTIFDWVPRYSIYNERNHADGEASEVEEWLKAQGHSGPSDERISLKQRAKNAYVELRFGLKYYDFPWQWKSFVAWLTAWVVGIILLREALVASMQKFSRRKPVQLNFKWENTDIYDILWYVGARKNSSDNNDKAKFSDSLTFPTNNRRKRPRSELERAGMHHMPKAPKKKSEYSHTLYSNTRSRRKKKNVERHKIFLKERAEQETKVRFWKEQHKLKEEEVIRTRKRKSKVKDGFSV